MPTDISALKCRCYDHVHKALSCKSSKACEELYGLWSSYLSPIDKVSKFFIFLSWLKKGETAQFKEADSRLTEAYHVLQMLQRVVGPLTQFPDAINILLTDMINSWPHQFVQFSLDHKKQEVGSVISILVRWRPLQLRYC